MWPAIAAMSRPGESTSYQVFMFALCVYTLVVLSAELFFTPGTETRQLLEYADNGICLIFIVDFGISLYRSPNRWRYLYTWGWLDLLSSLPALDVARWGRAARLARIVRVLRGVRATRILASVVLERRAQSSFLAAALIALLLVIFTSISILQLETVPESNIRTANDALWWALTTITTVGYGDRYPVTMEGRLVAGVLMCAGVGLFGMFSGFLAAWFVHPTKQKERNDLDALRDEIAELRLVIEDRLPPPTANTHAGSDS
jgi:voltage-gated potassium channel